MTLTNEELQVINCDSKRVLVVSGPGSGKTTVIAEKIKKLLADGIKPESIIALSFSEKSSQFLADEICKNNNCSSGGLIVNTTHAFGYSILKDYSQDCGLAANFSVADSLRINNAIKKACGDRYLPFEVEKLKKYIRTKKTTYGQTQDLEMEAKVGYYEETLRKANKIDYDDLVYLSVNLLESKPEIQKEIQAKYRYIFVDEYQDVSEIENRFIELLAGHENQLFIVGDINQAIFGNSRFLEQKLSSIEYIKLPLTENFRNKRFFSQAAAFVENRPISNFDEYKSVSIAPIYSSFPDEDAEFHFLAAQVSRLLKSGKFNPSDIAIICNNNDSFETIGRILSIMSIKSQKLDVDTEFKYSRFIKVLKAIADPTSDGGGDLGDALNFPNRILDMLDFAEAKHVYSEQNLPKLSDDNIMSLRQIYESGISFPHSDEFFYRYSQIYQLHFALRKSISETVAYLIKDFEGHGYSREFTDDFEKMNLIFAMANYYEQYHKDKSVRGFLDYLLLGLEGNDIFIQPSSDSVSLLSVRRAKGFEFKAVFVVDSVPSNTPFDIYKDYFGDSGERRRLLYTAMTRAQQLLFVVSNKNALCWEETQELSHFGFVGGLADEALNGMGEKNPVKEEQTPDQVVEKITAPIGSNVEEDQFDIPEVLANDSEATQQYLKSHLAITRDIRIPDKLKVVVIGASMIRLDILYGVFKANGIDHDNVEYYDYCDSKLQPFKFQYNDRYIAIILGPDAHKQNDSRNLKTTFTTNDGFPFFVDLVEKITKSRLQSAIAKIKINYSLSQKK
jgi:DNA helicase-2/ATP-dependent DNA helicase PcrA